MLYSWLDIGYECLGIKPWKIEQQFTYQGYVCIEKPDINFGYLVKCCFSTVF